MRNRKIKKSLVIKIGIAVIVIIILILGFNYITYLNSNEYKLKKSGYSKTEIITVLKYLKKAEIKEVLTIKHRSKVDDLVKQKYFIFANLKRYLTYYDSHISASIKDIVGIVNTNNDHKYYDSAIKTDITKGNLMLVNKYNYLSEIYTPKNLVVMKTTYAFNNNAVIGEVYNQFREMHKAAKLENYTLVVKSSYRSFENQKARYDAVFDSNNASKADAITARPGYSEHETGLAIDIMAFGTSPKSFEETNEYQWLMANAHKYGFIERFPLDLEKVTGFVYEPGHYRYVGIDVATKIFKLKITFDEYYAYYLK